MLPERIRERYVRDPLSVRLGGLAMDLGRIASCAKSSSDQAALLSLLEEGKWFAEWAAPEAPIEIQEQLAEIQVQLAWWQLRCRAGKPVAEMPLSAQRWSDRLLSLAGLV
jgi:hypothetical protein